MHQCRFNKNILCIVTVFFLSFTNSLFNGCSQKKAEEKAATTTVATHAWTDTIIGSWYIRIHSPEPGDHPGIWEGPVEIGKKPGIFTCTVDTSLIKGIHLGPKGNTLIIEAFSGSRVFDVVVNIDSCSK
jgi:hypothetical protein